MLHDAVLRGRHAHEDQGAAEGLGHVLHHVVEEHQRLDRHLVLGVLGVAVGGSVGRSRCGTFDRKWFVLLALESRESIRSGTQHRCRERSRAADLAVDETGGRPEAVSSPRGAELAVAAAGERASRSPLEADTAPSAAV
jgi:hypothetical protein